MAARADELRERLEAAEAAVAGLDAALGAVRPGATENDIAAEMVGAKAGLGYLILNSQYNFQIPQMYAGILTVSAIGVAFNYLLLSLERRFSTWRSA
mgnify:CR=1 FL=1